MYVTDTRNSYNLLGLKVKNTSGGVQWGRKAVRAINQTFFEFCFIFVNNLMRQRIKILYQTTLQSSGFVITLLICMCRNRTLLVGTIDTNNSRKNLSTRISKSVWIISSSCVLVYCIIITVHYYATD